jgi:hypothetical protein
MATIATGVVSDNTITANQRVIDMSDYINLLEDDAAPFTRFLNRVNKQTCFSQKKEWLSDELIPRLTALAATAASADTTIGLTAGTGQYFRVGDVLRIATTGENVAVTAMATDTAGVTRSVGGVNAATAASGVDVVYVGNAALEGATIGTLKQTKLTANFNYTQIQRHPFGATNTLAASQLYGGPDMKRERKKKLLEHLIAWEHTFFWGQRDLFTGGTQPQGFAGGLTDFIVTNITSAGSNALTQTAFETFLRTGFRFGSRNKVLFCSPLIMSGLSSFPMGKLAPPNPDISKWGVHVQQYQSGAGDVVDVVNMREWVDYSTNLTQFGGWAFLVDMTDVYMCTLEGNGISRDTKLYENRQAPDEDSVKSEYLTEATLLVGNEKNHAILKAVTAYS